MDKREMRVVVRGVIVLLEAVRSKRLEIFEHPYKFDAVCDALESRAKFMRNVFTRIRRGKPFVVRRRLYNRSGSMSADMSIVDGKLLHRAGKRVVHPNGRTWTPSEIAAETAQMGLVKARK